MTKRGPNRFRRVLTGVSISLTGGGIDTALVGTDGQHLQKLVDFIDDKGVFSDPIPQEVPSYLLAPVEQTRKLATAVKSEVHSEEAASIAGHIASACRTFMREFNENDPEVVWSSVLNALRKEIAYSVEFAIREFKVAQPTNLDLSVTKL